MLTSITRFVRGLTIREKLGLVAVAFAVPILVLLYLLVAEQGIAIQFARNERQGVEHLAPLRKLLGHLQEHRDLATATLVGDTASRGRQKLFLGL